MDGHLGSAPSDLSARVHMKNISPGIDFAPQLIHINPVVETGATPIKWEFIILNMADENETIVEKHANEQTGQSSPKQLF